MQFVLNFVSTQRKQLLIKFLKICIAILVILYLFKSGMLTKDSFIKLFRVDNVVLIFFSGLLFIISQMLCASRLVMLLRTINSPLRFSAGFKLIMIGDFFNTIIPGTIGGDFVKGYFLIKNEETEKGKSSGIIIMDRILGLIALTIIGGASLIYLLQLNNSILDAHRKGIYVVLSFIGFMCFLAGVFFIFANNCQLRGKFRDVFKTIFRKSIFYYLLEGVGTLAKNRRTLINALFISILIQLLSLTGLLILSSIVSEVLPNFITLAAVSSIIILLSVVPITPGNIGWTELIAAFGWSAVGSKAGAEIFFYWRIVTVLCSLPGGLLYLTYRAEPNAVAQDRSL